MFGIGLYEIKVPTLDQRIKVSYLAHCVLRLYTVQCFVVRCFAHCVLQLYVGTTVVLCVKMIRSGEKSMQESFALGRRWSEEMVVVTVLRHQGL